MRFIMDSHIVETHNPDPNPDQHSLPEPHTNYTTAFVIIDSVITILSIMPNFLCLRHIVQQLRLDTGIKNWLYLSLILSTCMLSVLGNPIYILTKYSGMPPLFHDADMDYTLCTSLIGIYLCAAGVLPAMLG